MFKRDATPRLKSSAELVALSEAELRGISDAELGELIEISRALTTERNIDRLLGLILEKARFITGADAGSIYDVPKVLHQNQLDAYVVRKLGLPFRDVDWTVWGDLLRRVHEPRETVNIALVGKYIDLPDAYLSVTEALRAGGFANWAKVQISWVPSDDCETEAGASAALRDVDGVLIPGGFGIRGIEGKLGAIRYARKRGVPLLGLCLGLQCIVIEAARSVGLEGASSTEFDDDTQYPVISTMADQEQAVAGEADLGGTMRLGAYPAALERGSIVAAAYGSTEVSERHRHRFEVNNSYRDKIAASGLVFSGTSPDGHTTPRSRLHIRLRDTHSSWRIVGSSNQMWMRMSETRALCCPRLGCPEHARLLGGRGRFVVVAVRCRGVLGGGRWAGCGEDEVIEVSAHVVAGA